MKFNENLNYSLKNSGIFLFKTKDIVDTHEKIIEFIKENYDYFKDKIILDNYFGITKQLKLSRIKELNVISISYIKSNTLISESEIDSLKDGIILIDTSIKYSNFNLLYNIVKVKDLKLLFIADFAINNLYISTIEIVEPTRVEVFAIVEKYFKDRKISVSKDVINQAVTYLSGMPTTKIKEVLRYSIELYKENNINIFKTILKEKKRFFRLNLSMEFIEEIESLSGLGGQNVLKRWLKERERALTEKARKMGIPFPKGVLLVGIQGCGKSLTAKAIAGMWKMPLLKMDFSLLFTSSKTPEEAFKENLQLSEKLSPIILWLDEIDKLFAASNTNSVELKRILGSFLTWLQEKKDKVFVVATANNIDDIPPELLRKGRFDEIFFLDLPRENERVDIFKIHLKKNRIDSKKFNVEKLAKKAEFFSGAEIEQVILSGIYRAFNLNRVLLEKDILNMIEEIVPFYLTYEDEIKQLKDWASTKARKASEDEELYEMFE